ncbi:hypothetical protein PHLCEN_2v7799 [Hermanssonia centrifuga]|uniref:HSF-type DNA-binding domain-containing protein n=1 Tax=Hermanssonia centrifuga TaxID=98765 RepID=A0A2R6NW37_9APHY|nr:hypothetical protein PHLCEN_2v7799 [Hermanssonia centrifuga]
MSADQQLALTRATRGESSHLSRAARGVVPPFLQKLYEIVNDPKNEELIRWSDNGDSFYVLNHERFAREVLGRWFKHQKFTSFVRQLNMYGFHKIPQLQQGVLRGDSDTEAWHFEHPHFHRGQPDLLCFIQRKKPAHGPADDIDLHDPAAPPALQTNLTAGQVLDINTIMNGISAIKRHQQAISSDLNELKSSNQHLWQEALAARERHKKHQDTINRILKFLAGVFGHNADTVKHDGSHDGTIPRKRQRLLIGDVNGEEKRKSAVEEVEDDEDRRSVRSDENTSATPSTPTTRFMSMDTPESSVQSPSSPSATPRDPFNSVADISARFSSFSSLPPVRPPEAAAGPSFAPTRPAPPAMPAVSPPTVLQAAQGSNGTLSPSSLMAIPSNQGQQLNGDWSAALQSMLSSPAQLQRLMQALANQQNQPIPPQVPSHNDAMLDPRLTTHQVAPYDPPTYDFSRFRSELPLPSASTSHANALPPSFLGPLIPKDDEGPSLEPLVESANRLQKTYHDASEIDADVDALQYSLNSLIHGLGLDSTPTAPLENGATTPTAHTNGWQQMPPADSVASDPTADFDYDAFFNELSSRGPTENGFTDVTTNYNPNTQLDGTTIGDASTDQLAAFLDDMSDTASLRDDPLDLQPMAGNKRKSDVSELPPPLLSNDSLSMQPPKAKRKR